MEQALDIELEPISEPPSGINGPTNTLEWLESSLLNEALYYFVKLQVQSCDEQEIAYTKKFMTRQKRLYQDRTAVSGYKTRKLVIFASSMGQN